MRSPRKRPAATSSIPGKLTKMLRAPKAPEKVSTAGGKSREDKLTQLTQLLCTATQDLFSQINLSILFPPQYTPSSFIAEMNLTTDERLARITDMYPPRIVGLMDIGATSTQKVWTTMNCVIVSVLQTSIRDYPTRIAQWMWIRPCSNHSLQRLCSRGFNHIKLLKYPSFSGT